jgi:16S rRNA (guanine527-N7)-methyltransferase
VNSSDFQERLEQRARLAGVTVDSELSGRLEVYFRLLVAWNQRINLTGLDLRDPGPAVLDRILVEPLAAARYVPPGTASMIDIGSGGGSPGIPLALAVPGVHLRMVESRTRKSVFLREAARAVGLQSAEVFTARYEDLMSDAALRDVHDVLTVRAVRLDVAGFTRLQTFVRPGGQLFLFRGSAQDELACPPDLGVVGVHPLAPDLSRLVVMEKPRNNILD